MTHSDKPGTSDTLGFAVGLGLCSAVLFGIPLVFWQRDMSSWLIYGLVFVLGAVIGALLAPRIREKTEPEEGSAQV